MTLGDWVRVVRAFVGGFALEPGGVAHEAGPLAPNSDRVQPSVATDIDDRADVSGLIRDLKVGNTLRFF